MTMHERGPGPFPYLILEWMQEGLILDEQSCDSIDLSHS